MSLFTSMAIFVASATLAALARTRFKQNKLDFRRHLDGERRRLNGLSTGWTPSRSRGRAPLRAARAIKKLPKKFWPRREALARAEICFFLTSRIALRFGNLMAKRKQGIFARSVRLARLTILLNSRNGERIAPVAGEPHSLTEVKPMRSPARENRSRVL